MKYLLETEFVLIEITNNLEHDKWISSSVNREETTHGPYKTKRGADNALKRRICFWADKGYRGGKVRTSPPRYKLYSARCRLHSKNGGGPEEVFLKIEEKEISREPV